MFAFPWLETCQIFCKCQRFFTYYFAHYINIYVLVMIILHLFPRFILKRSESDDLSMKSEGKSGWMSNGRKAGLCSALLFSYYILKANHITYGVKLVHLTFVFVCMYICISMCLCDAPCGRDSSQRNHQVVISWCRWVNHILSYYSVMKAKLVCDPKY